MNLWMTPTQGEHPDEQGELFVRLVLGGVLVDVALEATLIVVNQQEVFTQAFVPWPGEESYFAVLYVWKRVYLLFLATSVTVGRPCNP